MKTLILILSIFLFQTNVFSQIICHEPNGILRTGGDISNPQQYLPDPNSEPITLRLNFIFILKEQGSYNYPGNFSKSSDGYGNHDFNGYLYAENLTKYVNMQLIHNDRMILPPQNTTEVLSSKVRVITNGVYFFEDNSKYSSHYWELSSYLRNNGEAINIFFTENPAGGGIATISGSRQIGMYKSWRNYLNHIQMGLYSSQFNHNYATARTLEHEIGHNLSLLHTNNHNSIFPPCPDSEDFCNDTPLASDINTITGELLCCGWGTPHQFCSNNFMDYKGPETVVTPDQIGRMHWTIQNEMESYKECYYNSALKQITSFSDNTSYIAKNVEVPLGANVKVWGYDALYVNAEEFEVIGELEVGTNSIFEVNTVKSCN